MCGEKNNNNTEIDSNQQKNFFEVDNANWAVCLRLHTYIEAW